MADEVLTLLRNRLAVVNSELLADVRASLLFTAGGTANWTVELDRGKAFVYRGAPARAAVTVRAPLPVLVEVISGRRGGIAAFLAGDLTVRGNLALALELDGLFWLDDADDVTARARTRLVDAGGVRTFYLEAGPPDAPPVVLIHGLAATNASMLPLIAPLARDYRVLAPDMPGHGGTPGNTAMPHLAHDAGFFGTWLHAFLAATTDQPAVLIGNSLGGRTALQAALDFPDDVRGLVLLCPAVAFRRLRQLVPVVRHVRDGLTAVRPPIPRPLAARGLHALFADPSRLPDPWVDAAVDEFLRVWSQRGSRYAIFSALRYIYLDTPFGAGGFWDRLPELKPPALFVWGDHDFLVPAGFARHVEAALPEARSVVLPACGHVPQFEHPDQTNALIRDFLSRLPTP